MFIFSTRLNKKKVVAVILAIAVILCLIIVLAGRGEDRAASGSSTAITSQKDVEVYLKSLGWEIADEPTDIQEIVIPKEFSDVYNKYNDLQKKQGYDLTDHAGTDAVRYTYEILNYSDDNGKVVADIIVSGKKIIGADIQSVQMDGFMQELSEKSE